MILALTAVQEWMVIQMAEYDILVECQVIIDANNEEEAKNIAIKNIQNCLNPYYIEAYAEGQPVKCGQWENEYYDEGLDCYIAACSECGYESTDRFRISDNHKYCEYCGTRMIKGGDIE